MFCRIFFKNTRFCLVFVCSEHTNANHVMVTWSRRPKSIKIIQKPLVINFPIESNKHSSYSARQASLNHVSFALSQGKEPQVCYEPSNKPAENLHWLILNTLPWAVLLFLIKCQHPAMSLWSLRGIFYLFHDS